MRRNQRRKLPATVVGLIVILLTVVVTYLGFNKEIPFRHHYTIQAVFRTSNNLRPSSPVRIAGVNVGKVVEVKHLHPGEQAALVKMRIEDMGLPIHKDAKLKVRSRIFLEGNFFVDLQPGSPSAPIVHDGETIPINQTSGPVQLDQILTSLQGGTRRNLQLLLRSLSEGFSGTGGKGYNASIKYWEPAYRDSALVNDATLGQAEHDLSGYIANAGATAQALDRNALQLKSLITDFNTTARAFAVTDSDLSAAVAELPRTLRAGMPAFAALNRAFPPLRSFVADARPGIRSSPATIDATLPLVRQLRALVSEPELRGLVSDLRPTVPALARLQTRLVPFQQQVREASSCQNEVILPWSKDTIQDKTFPASGPVYQDSVKGLPGLAGESRSGDANGQWFRVLLSGGAYITPTGNGTSFLTGQPLVGANPPRPAAGRSPLRSNVPCETQQPPDLRTEVQPVQSRQAQVAPDQQAQLLAAKDKAVEWLRGQLKTEGLSDKIKVSSQPATQEIVDKLKVLKARAQQEAGG